MSNGKMLKKHIMLTFLATVIGESGFEAQAGPIIVKGKR